MVVYQALKRLTGSAEVLAVLDGTEYEEECRERGGYASDCDSSSNNSNRDALASGSYLTESLFAPPLHYKYEDDQRLDPASIMHSVSHNNGPWQLEPAFRRTEVTWLNRGPRSFKELAVAFVSVSPQSSFPTSTRPNDAQYGNQASIGAYYSAAVIISHLPEYNKRTEGAVKRRAR